MCCFEKFWDIRTEKLKPNVSTEWSTQISNRISKMFRNFDNKNENSLHSIKCVYIYIYVLFSNRVTNSILFIQCNKHSFIRSLFFVSYLVIIVLQSRRGLCDRHDEWTSAVNSIAKSKDLCFSYVASNCIACRKLQHISWFCVKCVFECESVCPLKLSLGDMFMFYKRSAKIINYPLLWFKRKSKRNYRVCLHTNIQLMIIILYTFKCIDQYIFL